MAVIPFRHSLEVLPYRNGDTANRSWQTYTVSSTAKYGTRFLAEATGTVTKVLIYATAQTAASSGVVRCGIQTISTTTGTPTGTWVSYGDYSWTTAASSSVTVEVTCTTTGSVTRGDAYAWVVEYVSGSNFNLGIYINAIDNGVSQPHWLAYSGGAWSVSGGFQNWDRVVYGYFISQWYGHIYSSWGHTAGTNCNAIGNVVFIDGTTNFTSVTLENIKMTLSTDAVWTDPIEIVIGTVSGTAFTQLAKYNLIATPWYTKSNSNNEWSGWADLYLQTEVTIPTNTKVFIGLGQTTRGQQYGVANFFSDVSNAGHWTWWDRCTNCNYATLSGSTITETTTRRIWASYEFSSVTASIGSSGPGTLTAAPRYTINAGIN